MNASEHRLEAERLTDLANALQFRALQARHNHSAALNLSTMAHAKRLQAKWHERRAHEWSSVAIEPGLTVLDVLRGALGPDVTLYSDCYGNIHSTREIR